MLGHWTLDSLYGDILFCEYQQRQGENQILTGIILKPFEELETTSDVGYQVCEKCKTRTSENIIRFLD